MNIYITSVKDTIDELEFNIDINTKIDTEYYNKYKGIVTLYNALIHKYDYIEEKEREQLLYKLRESALKANIESTYQFFRKHLSSVGSTLLRRSIDSYIGLNPDYTMGKRYNINRFNFEKIINYTGILKINIEDLNKVPAQRLKLDKNRYAIGLHNRVGMSNIVILKHGESIEFYDIEQHRTVAFKNFSANKEYGEWNNKYEELAFKAVYAYKVIEARKMQKVDKFKIADRHIIRTQEIFNEMFGSYIGVYKAEILGLTYKYIRLEDIIDDIIIKRNIIRAIDKLSKSNNQLGENIKEALELEEIEKEIQRIQLREQREMELAEQQKREEERKKELQSISLKKQREMELAEQQKREERERKYREYMLDWGECENEYRLFKAELACTIDDLDTARNSYEKHLNKRIRSLYVVNSAVKLLGINKENKEKMQSIYNEVVKGANRLINRELIDKLIDDKNKAEIEKHIKNAVGKSFVRLVDLNRLNEDIKDDLMGVYRTVKTYLNGYGKTSLIHNDKTDRGILIAYGNKIIDGGSNKLNQTQMELKLVNSALCDLCIAIGTDRPNSSVLNKFIETEILYAKSQRPDAFKIDERAINAFLVNRDRNNFTKLRNFDEDRQKVAIYIPCEYYAYIKEIFKCNEGNKLLKRSYGSVLNILVYEYLINMFNRSYIDI